MAGAPGLSTFPPFVQRPPWWGGDLQTVRNIIVGPRDRLDAWPAQRLGFPARDGSGDVLSGVFHRPRDATDAPLMVILHGLTGCEDSIHVRASAAYFLARGWPVLRLNLRGAGPSRAHCRGFYHAGRTGDLRLVLDALAGEHGMDAWVLLGYSLGGNLMLKLLAEIAAAPLAGRVRAAVSVSAPIDLAATWRNFARPRNRLYQRWLLKRMKAEATAPGAAVDEAERRAIADARTVFAFDDGFIAPRHGFAGAEDYYARCSAAPVLKEIATPTLVISAFDDPWVPVTPCLAHDWRTTPGLTPLLPRRGGHVGFHGRGQGAAWHDVCAERFLAAVAEPVTGAAAQLIS
jgi:predicted alpha/beta-fold hydrolase